MRIRGAGALVIGCAGLFACGDDSSGDSPDAGPRLDPAVFDCTSGDGAPDRASPVPIACALDPDCRTPQVTGHRGAGGELGILAPEDTLSAYRAGIAIGLEYVETDPRPTADGVIVNMHDNDVSRTTNGTGDVLDLTFDQIRALEIDVPRGMQGDFSCERVPTLQEILELCRDRVVVLVDANKTDRVDLLVQAIVDADAVDWAIFDTSSVDKIDQALAIDPSLHFMIRPGTVEEITTQLDHFAPRLPVIVELDANTRQEGSPIVHERGTRSFSDVFVEDLISAAQGDTAAYGNVIDQGVDILETDRPDLVIEAYRERGLR